MEIKHLLIFCKNLFQKTFSLPVALLSALKPNLQCHYQSFFSEFCFDNFQSRFYIQHSFHILIVNYDIENFFYI